MDSLQLGEIDDRQRLAGPVLRLTMRGAQHTGAERDLLENGAGEELTGGILKDESDVTRPLMDGEPIE